MTVYEEGKLIVNGEVHNDIKLDDYGVAVINGDVYASLNLDGRSYAVVNGVINGKTHSIDDGCCLEIHSQDMPAAHFILDRGAELEIYTHSSHNSELVKITSYDQELDRVMGFASLYAKDWPKVMKEARWLDEENYHVRYWLE